MIEVHDCVSTLYQHVSKLKQKTGCHSNIIHSLNTHVVRRTKVVWKWWMHSDYLRQKKSWQVEKLKYTFSYFSSLRLLRRSKKLHALILRSPGIKHGNPGFLKSFTWFWFDFVITGRLENNFGDLLFRGPFEVLFKRSLRDYWRY